MTEPKPRRLLKTKAAADYLSIRPQALRELVHDEQIPVVIFGASSSGNWRFDVSDLDKFSEAHKQIGA